MNTLTPTPSTSPSQERLERNAFRVALLLFLGALAVDGVTVYLALQSRAWQLYAEAAIVIAFSLAALGSMVLCRRGRSQLGMHVLIVGILATVAAMSIPVSGQGVVLGLVAAAMASTITAQTLTEAQAGRFTIAGILVGIGILLFDLFGPANRLPAPGLLQTTVPLIAGSVVLIYGAFIIRQFGTYKLGAKLVIGFLAVSLVPLGLLAFFNDRVMRASLEQNASRALMTAAAETATRLDDFINYNLEAAGTEAALVIIGDYLSLPADQRPGSTQEREIINLLFTLQNKEKLIRRNMPVEENFLQAYSLLDREGRVVFSTDTREIGRDRSGWDYFQAAFASADPYASDIYFSADGLPQMYFSARAYDRNLAAAGVLAIRFDAAVLQDQVAQNNGLAGPASFPVLFDENYQYLAHGLTSAARFYWIDSLQAEQVADLQAASRLINQPADLLAVSLPELRSGLADAEAQPFFAATDLATGDLVSQVGVARMQRKPWQIAFFQPQRVFQGPADAQTRGTILLAVAIALSVAVGAVIVSRQMSGPLSRLTAVTEAVTAGNLAARAKVETGDEIGALAEAFNSMAGQLQYTLGNLEQRVAERTGQLQAAAEIGRAATSVRDLDELLALSLQLIRERFGFYHASIFLADPAGEYAVLRESTGEVGAQLKARGHRLAIGSRSLIGWVTQNRQPRVALDTAEDPFHFKNPLLPETRSEAAIPLRVGDRLLGALDVQSKQQNAFDESAIQVLQTLADLLSVAIENAELFERTQADLEQVSSLYRQVAGAGWHSLLLDQSSEKVFDLQPGAPEAGRHAVRVPLRLHGEAVGVIELQGRAPDDLSVEEQAVLETAASQLAVALESATLFEEAQRRSRREQLTTQISEQIRASLNPATIVQNGIRELGRALGATEVVVQLFAGGAAPPRRRGTGLLKAEVDDR